MLLINLFLWALAGALEADAVLIIAGPHGSAPWWGLALVHHILYALILTAAGYMVLPNQYKQPRKWALVFLFLFALLIPVLSFPGLLLAILPALYWQKQENEQDWEQVPATGFPDLPFERDPNAMYLRGGLIAILFHSQNGKHPRHRTPLENIAVTQGSSGRKAAELVVELDEKMQQFQERRGK